MLVLAPATCCLAGIGTHEALLLFARSLRAPEDPKLPAPAEPTPVKKKHVQKPQKVRRVGVIGCQDVLQ